MNIGIIGADSIAKAHSRALSTIDNCKLVGVYDVNYENARELVKDYDGEVFNSYEELLEVVDGIIISSPNFCHKPQAVQALLKNKHVLVEKPMVISCEEAKYMMKIAKDTIVVAAMGVNYRYLSYIKALKSLIQNGELGEAVVIRLHFKKNSAFQRTLFTWRDDIQSNKTSGALGDLGIHLIDLLWFLFESDFREDTVRTEIKTNVKEKQKVFVDDYAEVYGQLTNKVFVNITTSKSSFPEDCGFSIEVIGTKKEYKYSSREPNKYITFDGLEKQEIFLPLPLLVDPENEIFEWADSFRKEVISWVNAAGGSKKSLATFEDGLRSQIILDLFFNKNKRNKKLSVTTI
ncbi:MULTISPECIES: Gfo/Idh/MocA family protein [Bacillus]|uniref:Gfo/Idh/MocA family protein n=1 Tax=Bacillus TaxID=1386 RepID=UPI000B5DB80C|nr:MULTISPECIES: Gfo/Idh/MocA family oxidoreductase [Bacillus]OXB96766.1 NTD biosynthesis operon oxidoreductase NtdC [Bacillus sp. M13(2017)]QCY64900.1 Gfo/Idh/MocA family oxidoreductase [Bacillus thuringiensis]